MLSIGSHYISRFKTECSQNPLQWGCAALGAGFLVSAIASCFVGLQPTACAAACSSLTISGGGLVAGGLISIAIKSQKRKNLKTDDYFTGYSTSDCESGDELSSGS